jgi:hypothetical protein
MTVTVSFRLVPGADLLPDRLIGLLDDALAKKYPALTRTSEWELTSVFDDKSVYQAEAV